MRLAITAESDLSARVKATLAAGQIAVLLLPCGSSVEAARLASRTASSLLEGLAYFPRGGLSRSSTPGLAAVAAHTGGPVGVDVEALVADGTLDDLAPSMLHPMEQRTLPNRPAADILLSLWVRKEAVLKACGVGLAVSPSAICTGPLDARWLTIGRSILGPAAVRSLVCPLGFVAALAIRGDQLPEVNVFEIELALLPGYGCATGAKRETECKGRPKPPFSKHVEA